MGNKKNQDYPFIKETIKQRPMDKRKVLEKLGVAAACGIVFGLSAVFIIMICMPGILDKYEQQIRKKRSYRLRLQYNLRETAACSRRPLPWIRAQKR